MLINGGVMAAVVGFGQLPLSIREVRPTPIGRKGVFKWRNFGLKPLMTLALTCCN